MPPAIVALVRAHPDDVRADIARALALAGLAEALPPGDDVELVLTPAPTHPHPAGATTPWQLEGAVLALRAAGATTIRCAVPHPVLRAHGVLVGGGGVPLVLPTLATDAVTTIAGATRLAAGRSAFALMDGTTAGDGPGPRAWRPVLKDVLLASADPVALDAVAVRMMGFDPAAVPHLAAAAAAGLGVVRAADITLVGDVALATQRWGFTVGGRLVDRLRERAAAGPLGELVARGEEAFAEVRWSLRDRAVFDHWRDATPWGQLHAQYEALGALAITRAAP